MTFRQKRYQFKNLFASFKTTLYFICINVFKCQLMYPIVLTYKLYFPYSTNYTLPYSSQVNVTVKASCYFLRINEKKNVGIKVLKLISLMLIEINLSRSLDFASRFHDNVKVKLCNISL